MGKLGRRFFLVLMISCLIFSSCSKDDNSNSDAAIISPEEKIIGAWQYFKYEESGLSWELDECEKKITYQFLENETLTAELYLKSDTGGCLHQTVLGYWHYLTSKDKFEIELDGTGTSTVEIVFSENNTVLTIINRNEEEFLDSFSFFKI